MSVSAALAEKYGLTTADIDKASVYQQRYGGRLENILVNLGALSEENAANLLAEQLGYELVQPAAVAEWDIDALANVPFNTEFLHGRKWLPLRQQGEQWLFAASDPLDWEANQYLDAQQLNFDVHVAPEPVFRELERRYQNHLAAQSSEADFADLSDNEISRLRELAAEAPTVNLVNSLFARALKQGASDLHLEPVNGQYRVRLRIDGVLHDVETLPSRLQLPVISRVKILAGMDIAEKRRPQDGKIELKIAATPLDIRVSALPLNDGESMVLRFLRKDSVQYELSVLGLADDVAALIHEDLTRTTGVILLTGPTGSGKTTSLYAFLNRLNNDEVKIVTLEDPVEYQLPGINQVQVHPDIGFDFAAGLRSVVRQDPDIVMVGEIRDAETARIAMQSSLTGHLVFSTVHTNDAPTAYTRLLDLGVEEYLLNAALVSIVAQRLVRKICPNCSEIIDNVDEIIEKHQLKPLAQQFGQTQITLKHGRGCDACANTGYRGRIAIIEYLRCDDAVRALPKDSEFLARAREHRQSQGWRSLREDGLLKAIQGQTTIDEVLRVAG